MVVVTKEIRTGYIPQRFSGSNRIPILLIGALLGRTSEDIIVPTVGGCAIGKRSVEFHIEALLKFGAHIEYRKMKKEGAYFAQAHEGLSGAVVELPYPSVGATENTILAAVRARGKTVIKGAAMEPEVIDLTQAGLDGHGGGDKRLFEHAVRCFHSGEGDPLTGIDESVESHLLAWAAEDARRTGTVVNMADFRRRITAEAEALMSK